MNAAQRAKRDEQILTLFVAGATYEAIAATVGLKSVSRIHEIVQRELKEGAKRRGLLTDEAFAVWQERQERLFRAHWGPALASPDPANPAAENIRYHSAVICDRILSRIARINGLEPEVGNLPPPTVPLPDDEDDDVAPQDELARLRAQRAGA
jgi:hypothetical protein